MGLAYFFWIILILGAEILAIVLLKAAWELWKNPRLKLLALIPFLLAVPCAVVAIYMLVLFWREPPWSFHF